MADEELVRHEFRDDLYARVVVAVVAKDVLLGDRASGDVEQACVCRAHALSVPVVAGGVCDNIETLEPG
jgi:hypothetical protein